MTKRFDRNDRGHKLHMQSLGAMMHYDFNQAGAYSYEQAMNVLSKLNLSMSEREQQFRRAVFNVLARNQDDHVKNIAYLMDKSGQWQLAPAFDMVYSYNPKGAWTGKHQMSVNGKRDDFDLSDIFALAQSGGIKTGVANRIVSEISDAVVKWPVFAAQSGIADEIAEKIKNTHRSFAYK